MAFDLSKLKVEPLDEKEVLVVESKSSDGGTLQNFAVMLYQNLGQWDTQKHPGIKLGPFESQQSAENFHSYYTSKASGYLASLYGWGKEKDASGNRKRVFARRILKGDDEKWYLELVRIRE